MLQPEWDLPDAFWRWALLAIVPAILAAGAIEKSAPGLVLPDEQSYRTPLSDALIESSDWRTPAQPEPSRSRKKIDLFPRYQSGNPNDFDHINREEKPQIKVFEFGS
jgi:hypothetical protein